MIENEKKQITNIMNAFKMINEDIRRSFNDMSEKLNSTSSFDVWKKWEKSITPTIDGYQDFYDFINGNNDWYYLNCYGKYKNKVVGFTFIISVNYEKNDDIEYANFLDKLDININKNTPMLCIFGVYTPIGKKIDFLKDDCQYVDDILQFTDNWKNYNIDKIKYKDWIDVEIKYKKDDETIIDGFEQWYKNAKVKIINITNISSKEEVENNIDELIKQT